MEPEVRIATSDDAIRRCFAVMYELRPALADAEDFLARVHRQRDSVGWTLAFVEDAGIPVACAGFRVMESLSWGRALYVDDLVCLESHRGKGFAKALMRWIEQHARAEGCGQLHLDSGTQRLRAHHFYYRQGLSITAFHFVKPLGGG
jgi:GNAT superfamily N-acetyltransferase